MNTTSMEPPVVQKLSFTKEALVTFNYNDVGDASATTFSGTCGSEPFCTHCLEVTSCTPVQTCN